MKTRLFILFSFLFSHAFSQQGNIPADKPANMYYVPAGAYDVSIVQNNTSARRNIKIGAIWMSNEITNKEYREFVDYAIANPNKFLSTVEQKRIIVGDSLREALRDSIVKQNVFVKYSAVTQELIDSSIVERENKSYKNYFTDTLFDDYPVVGVSYRGALYYCVWRTMVENGRLQDAGKPAAPVIRLPTEDEWAYVASQPLMKIVKVKGDYIVPSKSGSLNLYGLFNFAGNVSEWTSSFPRSPWRIPGNANRIINKKIVMGGSWKTKQSINESGELDQNDRSCYLGFRVVRSIESQSK